MADEFAECCLGKESKIFTKDKAVKETFSSADIEAAKNYFRKGKGAINKLVEKVLILII